MKKGAHSVKKNDSLHLVDCLLQIVEVSCNLQI